MKWLKPILDRKFTRAAKPPTRRNRANCVERNSSLSTFIGNFGESPANLNAYGNRAVFRIVVGSVRHEEANHARARRRKFFEEVWGAHGLSELVAGNVARKYPLVRQVGIDALHVSQHFFDEFLGWPPVLRVG